MHRKRRRAIKGGALRRPRAGVIGAALVVALCSVASGSTMALLSASVTGGVSTLAAASVTLANSAVVNCPVSGLLPDATPQTCTFTAAYSGSASAYLAVDVLIETQIGTGGTNRLYDPAAPASSLAVSISSTAPAVAYTVPTTATSCPGGTPAGSLCYELDNELIGTGAFASAAVGFSVAVQIPTTSVTGYQDGRAQIILTTHAVQSAGNTLSCVSGPAAGAPCTPSGSFSWS